MKIETAFNCGDKAWIFNAGSMYAQQVTVGQIRITHTESPGLDDEEIFDNYKPQSEHTEGYMCVETGIGSGRVYRLNVHIFATQEAAEKANADQIAKVKAQDEARRAREKQGRINERAQLLQRLKRLDDHIAADEARSA